MSATHPQYAPHPHAVQFPPLTEQRFKELVESIEDHGLQDPIEVQAGTSYLLDGRHRLRACEQLRRQPLVRPIEIADDQVPIYTAAKAAQRDGLTATQKVLVALALLPSLQKGSGKKAERAASAVGVSRTYVEKGIELREKAPELFAQVEAGDLGLSTAYGEYRLGLDGDDDAPDDAPDDSGDDQSLASNPDDDRFRVPERLRPPLVGVMRSVGGLVLADGIDALLAHCQYCTTWRQEAAQQKERSGR